MAETAKTEQVGAEIKPEKTLRQRLLFWLRMIVSLGLIVIIVLYYVPEEDRPQIIYAYTHLHLGWFAMAVLAIFTDRFVSGWKWLMLLRTREPDLPAWPVMQVFLVTSFLGVFLPSSIGGDALRIYGLNRVRRDLAGSASSVVIDRAYGTLGLLMVSALAIIPAVGSVITTEEAAVFWSITAVALLGVLALSSRRINRLISRLLRLDQPGKIRRIMKKLVDSFASFLHQKRQLYMIYFFSMLVQVLRVFVVYFFGRSLGIELDLLVYFVYVPLITVATFLPLSISGLGVREALFVLIFTRPEIGISEQQALSLSLLYFTAGLIASLPGLLIFMFTGMGRKEALDNSEE